MCNQHYRGQFRPSLAATWPPRFHTIFSSNKLQAPWATDPLPPYPNWATTYPRVAWVAEPVPTVPAIAAEPIVTGLPLLTAGVPTLHPTKATLVAIDTNATRGATLRRSADDSTYLTALPIGHDRPCTALPSCSTADTTLGTTKSPCATYATGDATTTTHSIYAGGPWGATLVVTDLRAGLAAASLRKYSSNRAAVVLHCVALLAAGVAAVVAACKLCIARAATAVANAELPGSATLRAALLPGRAALPVNACPGGATLPIAQSTTAGTAETIHTDLPSRATSAATGQRGVAAEATPNACSNRRTATCTADALRVTAAAGRQYTTQLAALVAYGVALLACNTAASGRACTAYVGIWATLVASGTGSAGWAALLPTYLVARAAKQSKGKSVSGRTADKYLHYKLGEKRTKSMSLYVPTEESKQQAMNSFLAKKARMEYD